MTDDIPEPDRAEGAPHPRETVTLLGQGAAEAEFLDAYNTGKLHHAWLITGPRGVGKATLAWRIARFLLAQPKDDGGMFGAPSAPESLDIDMDGPLAARVRALGEPRLFLLRRAWNDDAKPPKLRTVITVAEIRRLIQFFNLSATDGGRRVAIVDCADEMNPNAANALLKLLEEPPDDVVILLISHQPAGLLPTIRSRCRTLRCRMLGPQDQAAALEQAGVTTGEDAVALSELSGGSVGTALRLTQGKGLERYGALVKLFAGSPGCDRQGALALAESCAGVANVETYDITLTLIGLFLARLSRFGALQPAVWSEAAPQEARVFAALAPHAAAARRWAELAAELTTRTTHARAVNLDPSAVILDTLLKIDATARAPA